MILKHFVADNGLQAVPGVQNLLGCHSSHIQVLRQGPDHSFLILSTGWGLI